MKISIITPTMGGRADETARLFNSLLKQTCKNFEVIVVSQKNHEKVSEIIKNYPTLSIVQVKLDKTGLSNARNEGLKHCGHGNIIVLSDDDGWYPEDAMEFIFSSFQKEKMDVLLTRIYDPVHKKLYKQYADHKMVINCSLQMLSKSSIEISFRKSFLKAPFDTRFGLGSGEFICGEEIDFLLSNRKNRRYLYIPQTTVYHLIKERGSTKEQIIAKGALYKKHFNLLISFVILFRDLILKKENNFILFLRGYSRMKKLAGERL